MRYWDSSALFALFIEHGASSALRHLHDADPEILAWAFSDVEVCSAFERLVSENALSRREVDDVHRRFEGLWDSAHKLFVARAAKQRAKRLLRVHPLRAADSLQLGAALVAARDEPAGWEFVTLDERLAAAARREGFTVLPDAAAA